MALSLRKPEAARLSVCLFSEPAQARAAVRAAGQGDTHAGETNSLCFRPFLRRFIAVSPQGRRPIPLHRCGACRRRGR